MRLLFFFCMLTSLSCFAQQSVVSTVAHSFGYETYLNERFYYSVSYPNNMQAQEPSALNDGQKFMTQDERAEFTVWGYWTHISNPDATINEEYNDVLKSYGNCVTYKRLKGDHYIISGKKDGKIFYSLTKWRGDIGVTAVLRYDEQLRASYDKVCSVILKTLEFEDNDIFNK